MLIQSHGQNRSVMMWVLIVIVMVCVLVTLWKACEESFVSVPKSENNYLLSRPTQGIGTTFTWAQPSRLNSLYINDMNSIRFTNTGKTLREYVLDSQGKAVNTCAVSPVYDDTRHTVRTNMQDITQSIQNTSQQTKQYNDAALLLSNDTSFMVTDVIPSIEKMFITQCAFTINSIVLSFHVSSPTQSLDTSDVMGNLLDWYEPKTPSTQFRVERDTVVALCGGDNDAEVIMHQNTAGLILTSDCPFLNTHIDNWPYWTVYANDTQQDPPKDKQGNEWYSYKYNEQDVNGWTSPVLSYTTASLLNSDIGDDQTEYKMWASPGNDSSVRSGNKYVWFRFKYIP